MTMKDHLRDFASIAILIGCAPSVMAEPVTYTLRTVTDGQLGGTPFVQAEVTFQFMGDTRDVRNETSTSGATIYVNHKGETTVTIRQGGHDVHAKVQHDELFVRFDPGNGIAGFGSSISATYPVALGCGGYYFAGAGFPYPMPLPPPPQPDCTTGDWVYGNYYGTFSGPDFIGHGYLDYGTLDALADVLAYPADNMFYSTGTLALLPPSLSVDGVLSGTAHVCAGTYLLTSSGDLSCPIAAPQPIDTTLGPLYFQAGSDDIGYGALAIQVGGGHREDGDDRDDDDRDGSDD